MDAVDLERDDPGAPVGRRSDIEIVLELFLD
jgi:hypothetical protein